MAATRQKAPKILDSIQRLTRHESAFFIHPRWARRGLGRRLYAECESAARAAQFRSFELMATLPGEPFYAALGFTVIERVTVQLAGEVAVPLVAMQRRIDPR